MDGAATNYSLLKNSVTTTEIYLHSIDEIDRAAMEYLGAQIEKKSHTDSHTEKFKGLR
jgi:hypothetical protein